jgi:hypothetical protein
MTIRLRKVTTWSTDQKAGEDLKAEGAWAFRLISDVETFE